MIKKIIQKYLEENNIPLFSITRLSHIDLIVEGYRKSGWCAGSADKFTKKYFLSKPKNQRLKTFILNELDLAECIKCKNINIKENFHSNINKASKVNSYCPECHLKYQRLNKDKYARNTAKYKCAKLNRTPAWASLEGIADFYSKCPEGYEVDHIIPLQGKNVSGLHILENLQYLTPPENASKSNKFISP